MIWRHCLGRVLVELLMLLSADAPTWIKVGLQINQILRGKFGQIAIVIVQFKNKFSELANSVYFNLI